MAQYELNDGLAQHLVKPGEVRNPTGKNGGHDAVKRARELRHMVRSELNSPCDVKGFEHLTKGQYGVRALVALYMQAVPWAVKEVHNRAFGRVPMNIELDVDVHHEHNDLDYMTTAELIAYTDVLKQKLEAHANRAAIDTTAAVVEPEPEAK